MRDLTEEELALAPSWATHYIVDSDDSIIYESVSLCWWCGLGKPIDNTLGFGKMKNRPITGRESDITQHEWSDCDLVFNRLDIDCNIHLDSTDVDCGIFINKTDAIAIAKHFKLTAEDLK